MPITPLSKPLKTEYKPLGLEAFAQPLSQMQAKFDVAKSQIEDADYKINRLNWAKGEEEAAKGLINDYNTQASDLAGKLMRSGNYREAGSALKGINKKYNNDPQIQALQSNAAGYKAVVAEMDEAVKNRTMTSDYRDSKLAKIRANFKGTNYDSKTGEYNKINASSAMKNSAIEKDILKKADQITRASAEEQELRLGAEITRKLRGKDNVLQYDDVLAHLRQSSEFKEYSKEKAELEFFTKNESSKNSENPFEFADSQVEFNMRQLDAALEFYSKQPENDVNTDKIEEILAAKENLLKIEENKTQDPNSYFNTAENIYVGNHDYLRGVTKTSAEIKDYTKIALDKEASNKAKKVLEKQIDIGAITTVLSGKNTPETGNIMPVETEQVANDLAGIPEGEQNVVASFAEIDNTAEKVANSNIGVSAFTSKSDTNAVNKQKLEILTDKRTRYKETIQSKKDEISELESKLGGLSGNEEAQAEAEITRLQEENILIYEAKEKSTFELENIIKMSQRNDFVTKKVNKALNNLSWMDRFEGEKVNETQAKEINKVYSETTGDALGTITRLQEKSDAYVNSPELIKLVEKEKVTVEDSKKIALNITKSYKPKTKEELEEEAKNYNADWESIKLALSWGNKTGSSFINSSPLEEVSTEEQLVLLSDFNKKAGLEGKDALTLYQLNQYKKYVNGEHNLEKNKKSTTVAGTPARDNLAAGNKYETTGPVEYKPEAESIISNAKIVAKGIEEYNKNQNIAKKQEIIQSNNLYAKELDNIYNTLEEAKTLDNPRILQTNEIIIDKSFEKLSPKATQFADNVKGNMINYVIKFNPVTGEIITGKEGVVKTSNFDQDLYDPATMRAVSIVDSGGTKQTIYAVTRKQTADKAVQKVALSTDFSASNVSRKQADEGDLLQNQAGAGKEIAATQEQNPPIIYLTDGGTNANIVKDAKFEQINLLNELRDGVMTGKTSSDETDPAINKGLNNLANIELLDVNKKKHYVSLAANLQENINQKKTFSFSIPPAVVQKVGKDYEDKDMISEDFDGVILEGYQVYNTMIYQTKNGKLSYSVIRNVNTGKVDEQGKPIVYRKQIEAERIANTDGLPNRLVKNFIMYGAGQQDFIIRDDKNSPFFTDLGF